MCKCTEIVPFVDNSAMYYYDMFVQMPLMVFIFHIEKRI